MFENVIFPKGGTLGKLRKARRLVNVDGKTFKKEANRRFRSKVREALRGQGDDARILAKFHPRTVRDLC